MPRNSNGVYTLPSAQFAINTTISSTAVNNDFSDIASELTNSLATTGVSTMTAPLLLAAGVVTAPALTYGAYTTTGWYQSQPITSPNEVSYAVNGVQSFKLDSLGIHVLAGSIVDKNGLAIWAMPYGTVSPYGAATAPTNWLLCGGQQVSRTTYSGLYAAIGTTYGSGDGSTTFNVPDLRGRIPFGVDNMGGSAANRITAASGITGTALGAAGGNQNVTVLQANLPSYTLTLNNTTHTHSYNIPGNSASQYGGSGGTSLFSATTGATSGSNDSAVSFTSGGSAANVAIINPALIVTYIIYAGA